MHISPLLPRKLPRLLNCHCALRQGLLPLLITMALLSGPAPIGAQTLASDPPKPQALALKTEDRRLMALALLHKSQGDFESAIKLLRTAYNNNPDHLGVRRELAYTLLLNKEFSAAKYHFDALKKVDPNPDMKPMYQHFQNVIAQNRKFGFGLQFALLPSSNINNGSSQTHFNSTLGAVRIGADAKAKSGVGKKIGVSGYFQHLLSDRSRLSVNWAVSRDFYKHASFNSTVGFLSTSYQRFNEANYWSISPYVQKIWRENSSDQLTYGLQAGVGFDLSDRTRLNLNADLGRQTYQTLSRLDGDYALMSATVTRQISPSMSFSFGAGLERSTPKPRHLRYNSGKLIAEFSKHWEGGITTTFGLDAGIRKFDALYPNTSSAREDKFYKLEVGLQNANLSYGGFSPNLTCSHIRNASNVAFFDYRTTGCQLSLTRQF